MIIRDLEPADIRACVDITSINWGFDIAKQAETELREMHHSVQNWPPHYYVAEVDGTIVGWAGFRSAWMMTNVYEFIWINIHPFHQKSGVGTALTEKRIEEVQRRNGSVILLMTQKPAFFDKFGFEALCTNDNWMLMRLRLAPLVLGSRQ